MKKIFGSFVLLFGLFSYSLANSWGLDLDIISRSDWGADETMRLFNRQEYQNRIQDQSDYKEYINDIRTNSPDTYQRLLDILNTTKGYRQFQNSLKGTVFADKLVDMSVSYYKDKIRDLYVAGSNEYVYNPDKIRKTLDGQNLWWKLTYTHDKNKIIVHHTDNDYNRFENQSQVEAFLRNVYRQHSFSNGWGDVGYHFFIDHFGNIYEGRAGGEGIVGGHTKYNNIDTLGISLIGDFQHQNPTDEQIESLIDLTSQLAYKYNISPLSQETYFKNTYTYPYITEHKDYSIIGHGDVWATSCPGRNLHSQLDDIRQKVKSHIDKLKNLFVQDSINVTKKLVSFDSKASLDVEHTLYGNIDSCSISGNSISITDCVYQNGKIKLKFNYNNYKGSGKYTVILKGENFEYSMDIDMIWLKDLEYMARKRQSQYEQSSTIPKASSDISKIDDKIDLQTASETYLNQKAKVLLYELTVDHNSYDINCDGTCMIYGDDVLSQKVDSMKVSVRNNGLDLTVDGQTYSLNDQLFIAGPAGKDNLIRFDSYNRESYVGIPRNTFRGNIVIKPNDIKPIGGSIYNDWAVINLLEFDDYLKGIAEMNDQQPMEKIKAMAVLVRTYLLFYMSGENKHPSVPDRADYEAVDDARIFQKYVGAGYEKTSKKRPEGLQATKNQIAMYEDYVPILPYFNCSPGFTLSAKERFGWTDTPYLNSRIDPSSCDNNKFNGHGVGLSGNGAEHLASIGMNYKSILKWFYEGISIVRLND